MTEAFLHRQQHVGIRASLDMDDPVGMEAGKTERRSEQVAPAQAPEDRAIDPRENSREEDCRRRIIAEFRAAGDFMEGAAGQTAARKMAV